MVRGRVVHRETTEFREDLTRDEVLLACLEDLLKSDHVVDAVLLNLGPELLGNRLVPRDVHLLVVQSQFNLELLQ